MLGGVFVFNGVKFDAREVEESATVFYARSLCGGTVDCPPFSCSRAETAQLYNETFFVENIWEIDVDLTATDGHGTRCKEGRGILRFRSVLLGAARLSVHWKR